MNYSPSPSEPPGVSVENPIIRNFGTYSLSFPCNPHDLRTVAAGFQILFWSDFLLVAALWLCVGSVFWFSSYSEQFQAFAESLTPERIQYFQTLSKEEYANILSKELPVEKLAVPAGILTLLLLGGFALNVAGTCMCMTCPGRIIPKSHRYGLAWFGAFLASGIVFFLGPLLFLFSWQYWLTFLSRLANILGENQALLMIRRIHRTVFYCIMAFFCLTLFQNDTAFGTTLSSVSTAAVLVFFALGFLQYARLLKLLRSAVFQMIQYWDYGNDTLPDFSQEKK